MWRSTDGGATWNDQGQTSPGGSVGWTLNLGTYWFSGGYPGNPAQSTNNALTWAQFSSGVMPSVSQGGATDGVATMVVTGATSSDQQWTVDGGTTWHHGTGPADALLVSPGNIIWDGTQFVLIGVDGGGTNYQVYTAPSGFGVGGPVWTQQATGTTNEFGRSNLHSGLTYDPSIGYVSVVQGPIAGGHLQPGFVIASTPAGLATASILLR